jgi:RNA polymerase-binding transcription factor DksA
MPDHGGTLLTMQTEWSPDDDDDRPGGARTGPPPWAQVVHTAPASDTSQLPVGGDSGDAAAPPAVDGRASGSSAAEAGPVEEMAPGEEELHREAVATVDGLLDEVELALARLDDGTYGRCDECGAPIDDDRLAQLPIIRSCARCAVAGGRTVSGAPGETSAPAVPRAE